MAGRVPQSLLTIVGLTLIFGGCQPSGNEQPSSSGLVSGAWQATIASPGGSIETAFEISSTDNGYTANLVNGQERFRIEDVNFVDGRLQLHFPVFNNTIDAQLVDGELRGQLTLIKQLGRKQELPFHAVPWYRAHASASRRAGNRRFVGPMVR